MIELFIIQGKNTLDVTETVKSVDWFGRKTRAPRTVKVSFVSTKKGLHQKLHIVTGNGILFKWKKKELFRGMINNIGRTKDGNLQITANDHLFHLLRNSTSKVFKKQTASSIAKRLMSDFNVPVGDIANTGYVIASKVFKGNSLYDIIMTAIDDTHKHTKNRYYLMSIKGKVYLINRKKQAKTWVIEDGVNLIDFNYSTDIDDTYTQVVVEAGQDKKTIIAKAVNAELQKRFGTIQHFERTTDKLNKAQAETRAKSILSNKGKLGVSLSVDALGIDDVISGRMVRIIASELGVSSDYYIDYDFHTFSGNDHIMKLDLIMS